MNPAARRLLSMTMLLAITALLGSAGGFAYAHDPQREVLTIALDTSPANETRDTPLAGTVVEVSNGRLHLDTASGMVDAALPATARIEELRSLPLTGLTPGVLVNVGIERSESSTAISGIVAVEPR